MDKAFRRISEAEAPLILAGGGVIASGASEGLIEVADALDAPILFTRMGKGAVPEDHPLCFGHCRRRDAARLIGQADCVVALGVRFTDLSTETWQNSPRGLIHVNIDPADLGRVYRPEVPVVGDVKDFLARVLERLEVTPYRPSLQWKRHFLQLKEERKKRQVAKPRRIFDSRDLREVLPRDAIVSVDVCMPGYAMFSDFEVYEPRAYLAPTLFVSMGYALPAALGAKAAFPRRQVVSISGDGGFLMTCTELASAKKHALNVVSIVINDRCYESIKYMQDEDYGGRHIGVDLPETDFVKLAEAFGVPGATVDRTGELKPVLEKALESDTPYVIDVRL